MNDVKQYGMVPRAGRLRCRPPPPPPPLLHGMSADPGGGGASAAVLGFRIFQFQDSLVQTLIDLYDTAMLFLPAMTGGTHVPESCAAANLQFMQVTAYV